jgi:hypothetical protein
MKFINYQQLVIVAIAGCLSVATVGCETKVSQCNKLIKIANAASTEMQQTSQSQEKDKVALLKKMGTSLDGYSKEVGGLELKDEKLQGFQKRFVTLYQSVGDASRGIVAAAAKKDIKAAQQSLAAMSGGASQETALISEVNQYCSGK